LLDHPQEGDLDEILGAAGQPARADAGDGAGQLGAHRSEILERQGGSGRLGIGRPVLRRLPSLAARENHVDPQETIRISV
jgi:hypothetical protein